MGIAVVTLKKGEGRLLKSGGMWIFDNEIDSIMGSFENGDIVLVHDFDGYPMGRGPEMRMLKSMKNFWRSAYVMHGNIVKKW